MAQDTKNTPQEADARLLAITALVTFAAALGVSGGTNVFMKIIGQDLPNGERIETVAGQVRPRNMPGTPTPAPEEGWQSTDIISATLIMRGPGWRLLDFKLLCCTEK